MMAASPLALLLVVAAVPAAEPVGPVPDVARAGAAVDPRAFRFARPLQAAPAGLAELSLDAHVLAQSRSLADLRLAGPDGRQLPYLVERRTEPMAVPLAEQPPPTGAAVPRELTGRGWTLHALHAPAHPLPESQLVLETATRVFSRKVQVWTRREGSSGETETDLVADALWEHADPDRPAPPLILDLMRLGGPRLLVAVSDGDNARLPLSAARLLLPSYRLRFFHPGAPVTLLYGADLPAPEYDLALLAPRLRAAAAREVALGPPPDVASPAGRGEGAQGGPGAARIVFWIVLGLAVLALLALIGRLLARGENAPP